MTASKGLTTRSFCKEPQQYNEDMSLVLSIEGKDCIVSVADSRETGGDANFAFSSKDIAVKIQKLSDVVVSGAGSAQYFNSLIDQSISRIQGKKNINDIVEEIRKLAVKTYTEWFKPHDYTAINNNLPVWPVTFVFVAGYELTNGKRTVSKIYCLPSNQNFAPMLYQNWGAGGIPNYAQYLLNRLYNSELTKEQLIELSLFVMGETISQDGRVGGVPKVFWLQKDGSDGELTEDEVNAIIKKNDKRLDDLRKSFLK